MKKNKICSESIYSKQYFVVVPGLVDESEQNWKADKLYPYLEEFLHLNHRKKISILDVGGGSGKVLICLTKRLKERGREVNQCALDMTKDMLHLQKRNNPALKRMVVGDISKKTVFKNEEFDLALFVDVLEHIKNIKKALKETRRIAKYVIIKIPVEKSLLQNLINFIFLGRIKHDSIQRLGHFHFFNISEIKELICRDLGEIKKSGFANTGELILNRKRHLRFRFPKRQLYYLFYKLSTIFYKVSPEINSRLVFDSYLVLVKCY